MHSWLADPWQQRASEKAVLVIDFVALPATLRFGGWGFLGRGHEGERALR
jgi:hypothetical protein